MARLAVVMVPYFLAQKHRTLAERMVESVRASSGVELISVVNRVRSEDDTRWLLSVCQRVIFNDHNNLARAWNTGIREAFTRGAEYVVVANTDIVFHQHCLDNLYECAQQEADAVVWSALAWRNSLTFWQAELRARCIPGVSWSCFMVSPRLFSEFGTFDEAFVPAYREDSDMEYRIRLGGGRTVTCGAALFCDADRGTIKGLYDCEREDLESSAALLAELRRSITRNDERYIRKWGGFGGQETFTVPYNGAEPFHQE